MAPSQVDSNAVQLINQLKNLANSQQGAKSGDVLIDFAQMLLNGHNNHENSAGTGQQQSNAGISDLLEKGIDLLEDVKELLNTNGLETESTNKAANAEGKVDAAGQTETDEAASIPELIGKLVEGLQQLVESLKSAAGEATEASGSAAPAEAGSAEEAEQTAAAADETEDAPPQNLQEVLEKITGLLQELVAALKDAGIIEGGPEEAASGAEDAAKTGSENKAEATEAAEAAEQKETEEAETPTMEELLTKLTETLEELIAAFKEAGLIEDDAGKAEEAASAEETASPSAANAAEDSSETDQEKTIEELMTQLGELLEQLKAALSQPEEGGQAGQPINIDTGSGDDTVIIGPSGTTEEAEAAEASGNAPAPNAPLSESDQKLFHHYNPNAWHGKGSALVLPPGVTVDSVTIDGKPLEKHGALDKGREVWTDYNAPGMNGRVEMRSGDKTWTFDVTNNGMQYGQT